MPKWHEYSSFASVGIIVNNYLVCGPRRVLGVSKGATSAEFANNRGCQPFQLQCKGSRHEWHSLKPQVRAMTVLTTFAH
jgi:hypothetical protein